MVEAVVEDRVCEACGAEVRPDTQYCYNCGSSVMDEASPDASGDGPAATPALEHNGSAAAGDETPAIPMPETAAAIRKRSREFQRKPVRVSWEPADDSPNPVFIISVLVLLGFAVIAILLALYFK